MTESINQSMQGDLLKNDMAFQERMSVWPDSEAMLDLLGWEGGASPSSLSSCLCAWPVPAVYIPAETQPDKPC